MSASRSLTTILFMLTAVLLSSCMTGAYVATNIENANRQKLYLQHLAIFKQHIKALQNKGDPLGDYFYALGNSDGWIEDVKDPEAITVLFERAAAKGSIDAKILLALQEASNDAKPGDLNTLKLPSDDLKGWETGLAKLLPLLQQQCYARRLAVGDGILSEARPKVSYHSIAYEIWPTFRDGHHVLNDQGVYILKIAKDPERQKIWEDIDNHCQRPRNEWLDTLYPNKA